MNRKKNKKKKIIIISIIFAVLAAISVWIAWGNSALMVNEISVTSDELPQSFSGYKIAQVSDLHNAQFGKDNEKLIEKLNECEPDIIVLTGDLIDSYHTNIDVSISFAEKAVQIAPTYYVTGNHEARIDGLSEFLKRLEDKGVTVLQNESVTLNNENERITLLGVSDPSFQADYLFVDEKTVTDSAVSDLMNGTEGYTVLLSHRPEMFDVYVKNNVDLVLTGHAHGGQFRLPFFGGLVAPGQGLFPKYDSGLYTMNGTNMIVSRGIGNSIIPFRVNNRPEIVMVELSSS